MRGIPRGGTDVKKLLFFVALLALLGLCVVSAFAQERVNGAVFAEDMARAQSKVSEAQAEAISAQARAIEQQAKINEAVVRANLERERSEAALAKVGIVAITIGTLALLVVLFLVARDYQARHPRKEEDGKS